MRNVKLQDNQDSSANKAGSDQTSPSKKNKSSSFSSLFALYTWGGIATASLVLGGFFLITEINIDQTIELAEAERQEYYDPEMGAYVDYKFRLGPTNKKSSQKFDLATLSPATQVANLPTDGVDEMTTGSIKNNQTRIESPKTGGFGINLGVSSKVDSLASRYLAISNRAPELFVAMQPKVKTKKTEQGSQSSLIVGPFASNTELASFCGEILARMALDCAKEKYAGHPLTLPGIE